MATREAPGLLPRRSTRPILCSALAGIRNRAMVAGFGLISWPWLLRSLDGGMAREKSALLDRLGLPEDALPSLGSWKADIAC